jgi:lipopolysaccharide export system protein LptA
MLRSEAARYARWSAAIALLLAGATAVVYLKRGWTSHIERKNAPPSTPVDVSRQSAGITFKKFGEQNRVVFIVDASKSTDFKGEDATLLEDVKITIFGKGGDRNDVIHTKSCRYGKANGGVTCTGDVQLDLMSAADARRIDKEPSLAKSVATHVETRGVTFDRNTGLASTDQRVIFGFPSGSGEAIGIQYNADEGTVRLLRDVRLRLVQVTPSSSAKSKTSTSGLTSAGVAGQEVHVKGNSLDFARDTRLMRLHGPAEAETSAERLTAGEILLTLDDDFKAQKLVATAAGAVRPQLVSSGSSGPMKLEADTLTAHFTPEGSVIQVLASGAVHGLRGGSASAEDDEVSADSGTLDLWPKLSQPRELNLSGSVSLRSDLKTGGETRVLQTSALRMEFSEPRARTSGKPLKAETLAAGTVEWADASSDGAPGARTRLQADKLVMDFAEQGKARRLQATGNVQTERRIPGHAVQTASAHSGEAQIAATGGWSQMDLQGDVKLKEGDRAGQADHATFVRVSQTAVLAGHAIARDAATETHAPRILFDQASGDISADGGVRSTDFSSKASAVQLAPAPANITADSLQANAKTGRAIYSGHARMWQGDSVLEANSIELLRDTRVLNASGNVRAVFPQAPAPPSGHSSEPSLDSGGRKVNTAASTGPKKPQLWHVTAGSLTYQDKEGHAHLQQNVIVQSADQKMRGPVLDLYFTRAGDAVASNPTGGSPGGGAQQISRAIGTGGVTVERGGRQAVADRGEYTAANGKFVMSGGTPTIYDGSAGTTTGRQLTFFLADDTIIVDSENGSRILTKHRIEK